MNPDPHTSAADELGRDRRSRAAALAVLRRLREAGHVAYFAGGCVRDELLGLSAHDFDVATDAIPPRVAELFRGAMHVGASFGVMIVREQHVSIEVATFRADGTYTDNRRPDAVRFSDPIADAHRRDFTVNALFLDPLAPHDPAQAHLFPSEPSGLVIDHVGGIADLQSRTLRAVGDPNRRLEEDHLRALRAARLAAKLGFTIDAPTADAIRAHAAQLRGVSRERVGDELRKLMQHESRARGVELLRDLGLDVQIAGAATEIGTPRLVGLPAPADFATCLAAWSLDRGGEARASALIATWRALLCLSNIERQDAEAVIRIHARLRHDWATMPVSGQKRMASDVRFESALSVLRAEDSTAAEEIAAARDLLARTPGGLSPEPFLTGDRLIARGFTPGPVFKKILDEVYNAQLEGRVATPQQADELAIRLASGEPAGGTGV